MELVKMVSYWIRIDPKPNAWHPYKKSTDSQRKTPHEDRTGEVAANQGMMKVAGHHQKLGRQRNICP